MASLDFEGRVEATELDGGAYVVSAHGPLDGRVAGLLRDVLVPLAAADGAAVYLDLTDAHGLDGDALAIVGIAAHLASRRGERLILLSRSDSLVETLREWGLDQFVRVQPSLRDALHQ